MCSPAPNIRGCAGSISSSSICFAVPVHGVLVPLFQMISAAGFLNSRLAIVLPYAAYGIPFTTVLFYAFFLDFPKELEDAARLDNCNRVQTFFRVILPLSGPALASASIFQAVFIWNEFLLALLMLTRPALKTLPVGIFELTSEFTSDWPAVMAGLSIAIIPIIDDLLLLAEVLRQKPRRGSASERLSDAEPRHRRRHQALRRLPRDQGREFLGRARRVHRHGRAVGLREVDAAPDHRRARADHRRAA